jgi:thiol-disulfide isomerase/thioredoxin
MTMKRSVLLRAAAIGGAVAVLIGAFAEYPSVLQPMTSAGLQVPFIRDLGAASKTPSDRELRSIDAASEWINSPPLTASELRGKVVLVEFWTYTCINWLRAEPYVRAWAEKYRDQGLVVIGVHTPEFTFEQRIDNVRRAAKDLKVQYPIVIDNDYRIWRGFRNQAWPAFYFVDAQGRVRYRHFGEGDYERSEQWLQQLLAEAGHDLISRELVSVEGRGVEAAADWNSLRTPETYVGYQRTANFASPGGALPDKRRVYEAPERLRLNHWALTGSWTVGQEFTRLNDANGRVVFRFHARDLHLVMGLPAPGNAVRFRVLVDGRPPGSARGLDVDEDGYGSVAEQRMYQLIRQPPPITDHLFEIQFMQPGVEVFAFTFG